MKIKFILKKKSKKSNSLLSSSLSSSSSPRSATLVDIKLFQRIINNKILSKYIFSHVNSIFKIINNPNTITYKWSRMNQLPHVLASNLYIDQLKLYYYKRNNTVVSSSDDEDEERSNLDKALKYIVQKSTLCNLRYFIDTIKIQSNATTVNNERIYNKEELITTAARFGKMEILKYLESLEGEVSYRNAMIVSPLSGSMEMLKYVVMKIGKNTKVNNKNNNNKSNEFRNVFDSAAIIGRNDMIKWLISHRRSDRPSSLMYHMAVQGGQLGTLKYLEKIKEPHKFTKGDRNQLLDHAVLYNRFDILLWLHRKKIGLCTSNAMDIASKNNNMRILKWLHHNRTEGCTQHSIIYAAINGNLNMLQWIHENRSEINFHYRSIYYSIIKDHPIEINFYNNNNNSISNNKINDIEIGLDSNYGFGSSHFEVFKWLVDNRTEHKEYWPIAMEEAVGVKRNHMVRYLYERHKVPLTINLLEKAYLYHNIECFEWILNTHQLPLSELGVYHETLKIELQQLREIGYPLQFINHTLEILSKFILTNKNKKI